MKTPNGLETRKASLAVSGVNGTTALCSPFTPRRSRGQKRRYGVAGASYVSVVEFGPKMRAFSLHTFGAREDPKSRHYLDQAVLYARGEF